MNKKHVQELILRLRVSPAYQRLSRKDRHEKIVVTADRLTLKVNHDNPTKDTVHALA